MPQRRKLSRRLSIQSLENRRVLAASLGWDGPGLGSADLTYTINGSPDSLSQEETNAAIRTALDAWADVVDISFTQTDQVGLNDSLDISFTQLDGTAGTLAQAYFPDDVNPARIAGDIQFDLAENWEVGNSQGGSAFDLVWVAVHEIGHALGLDHLEEQESILASFVSANQFFTELDSSDVAAITQLYAEADPTLVETDDTLDTTTPDDELDNSEPDNDELDDSDSDDGDSDPVDDVDDDTPLPDDSSDSDEPTNQRRRFYWSWWTNNRFRGRFAGRLDAEWSFTNYVSPTDVNQDNSTSALDALMIINVLNQTSGEDLTNEDFSGLCDVNGDGDISSIDALMVINAMNESSVETATNSAEENGDETDASDETMVDEPSDAVDEEASIDEGGLLDEDADEEDTVVIELDDPELDDPELDEADDPIAEDPADEDDAQEEQKFQRHRHGLFRAGIFRGDAESLLERLDDNDDGSLTEDETPEHLWNKLIEADADLDADGVLTTTELAETFLGFRQEKFDRHDADGDGLINESEVRDRIWAKISEADADEDGGVSFEELEAFRQERLATEDTSTDTIAATFQRIDSVFASMGRPTNRGQAPRLRR
ncbi:matrixin family metalloprotease [Rhodopirellula sp. JC737]|nr:matrixin family metalloprotease [Rhodopirellula sp. JC737]